MDDGNILSERPADSDGTFYFDDLHEKRYRIVVFAPGFETHQQMVEFGQGIRLAVCNVTLVPVTKDSDEAAAAEPRSDSRAPKNARKEYEKASKDLAARDFDKAKADLEKAVKLYPCYARAQAHLATVLEVRHDSAGAEAALRKAIECDPDYLSSYIVLGQMLNDQRRFAESLPVLEAGARRAPSAWQLCYQLGVAYFGLDQYAKAEKEYQNVLEFNPSPPAELPLRLADIHLKEKAYDKAYAEMKQYLQADPTGRFAGKVRGIMQQIDASGVLNHPSTQK
jgi:tetratricopeptide (TPR) repeat protein